MARTSTGFPGSRVPPRGYAGKSHGGMTDGGFRGKSMIPVSNCTGERWRKQPSSQNAVVRGGRASTVCKHAQVPSKNNVCASFQLPRGVYKGLSWKQRIAKKRYTHRRPNNSSRCSKGKGKGKEDDHGDDDDDDEEEEEEEDREEDDGGMHEILGSMEEEEEEEREETAETSAAGAAGSSARVQEANRARLAYGFRKTALTRSVFMGLLSREEQGLNDGIVCIPEHQPYADGTVFLMRDFRRACICLMRAYEESSSDPEKIQTDAHVVVSFLDRAEQVLGTGGRIRFSGVTSKSCKQWLSLKNSIGEANVQPMYLVAKNAGIRWTEQDLEDCFDAGQIEEEDRKRAERSSSGGGGQGVPGRDGDGHRAEAAGIGSGVRKDKPDWYACRKWFIAHSIVPASFRQPLDASEEDNDDLIEGCGTFKGDACKRVSGTRHQFCGYRMWGKAFTAAGGGEEHGDGGHIPWAKRMDEEAAARKRQKDATPFDKRIVDLVNAVLDGMSGRI